MKNAIFEISIPMPFQIVVEDVGWWSGTDGSRYNEPFRTGMGRPHHLLDYQALATLGKSLGMRPQLSFVLCEWDRKNILKKVPTATWMGKAWNNTPNIGPRLDAAAHILAANRDHLEIGLHGVGHEYWEGGVSSRTEFHDQNGVMRPRDEILRHLDCFGEILEQNGLGVFPESFVPPALNHSFGNGEAGFQEIVKQYGVKYVSTIFERARQFSPPRAEGLTWERGVILLERGEAPVPWHRIAAAPEFSFESPLLSLHWANLLHPDPARNREVVERWVDFIREAGSGFDRLLSGDTPSCWTQFVFRTLSEIRPMGRGFEIHIAPVTELPRGLLKNSFTVRVRKRFPERSSTEDLGPRPTWALAGGKLVYAEPAPPSLRNTTWTMEIFPEKNSRSLHLYPDG